MTFWQKSSEKCELLGLVLFWVSSLVGIVLLPVPLERGMFDYFGAKQKYFSSTYLCKIVTKGPYVLS